MSISDALRGLGAELIWVDIGHFDIEPPEVDLKRVNRWAAQWENRVKQDLAEAEGVRDAYLEVGQEVRQAALINAIVRSLGQANVDVNDPERWRALILSEPRRFWICCVKTGNLANDPVQRRGQLVEPV